MRSLPDPLSPVISTVASTSAHSAGQVHDALHGQALGDDAQRLGHFWHDADQRATVAPQLAFRCFQRFGDAVQRDIEALLQTARHVELQLFRAFIAPLCTRAAEQMTSRAAFADAAVLEHEDFLLGAAAEIAARQPRNCPANRLVGAPEMQQVLLRFVRRNEHHAGFRKWALTAGRHVK
jgi:hypothetical protein